jgi:3-hydroxybutyryl-CoA dehydratase
MINSFAELTGDRNPMHLDKDAAVRAGLPGTIAHGYLLISLIPQLLEVEFPPASSEMITNRALDWVFRNPVMSGDSVCLEVTVEKMATRDNTTVITLKLLMKAQSNSKVVGQGSAVLCRIQHAQT